ncbi:MAG: DUF262 domain-containing HNH endonuclease family protein [Candidatus Methanoperedens sp.]|nr:DUF262 domain-containing HNH endonuclease family protein [Candidatus Methanoperedens sp.]
MPTNNVTNRTFAELFNSNIRFEIPFFQRGYAWEKRQWDTLFFDVDDQILSEISEDNDFDQHEHFFGPIVVLEKSNSDPQLKRFLVIDGQQRITTIYLLLALISELLKSKSNLSEDANQYVIELDKYLKNDITDKTDDYKKLKVYSNKGDRLPLYTILFKENPVSPYLAADQQLYIPSHNKIDLFSNYARKKIKSYDVQKLWQLAQALLKCLKIVWIPLDENRDDPQSIFESLNDKGIPLSASELLCNFIFKPLIDDVTNQHETLHTDKWLKSIKEVGGDDNFEHYLRNLFSIDQKKMIGKGRRIYVFFKLNNKNLSKQSAFYYLNDISDCGKLYNQITNPTAYLYSNTDLKNILIKIKQTNMESSIPFLLAILKAIKNQSLSEGDAVKILDETLVLLVRRKICELKTTKYDVFFPSLFSKIKDEPNKIKAIQDCIRKEDLGVSDQEFKDSFINKSLYKQTELSFARLILQEIDKKMQSHGQLPDYTTINTIEHIMPQSLDAEWKDYIGTDANDLNLDRTKNSIGNLCLISKAANSFVGQDPFEKKKNSYTDVSALTRDIKARNIKWNIASIKDRSKALASYGLDIWKWS